MGASDLLARLSALGLRITREGTVLRAAPKSALTDEARAIIRANKAELLAALCIEPIDDSPSEPAEEARRQHVLDMLARNPSARYAIVTDTKADPDVVILALAIRGRATCELRIPRDKYAPFLLLDLIRQHSDTIH